MTKKKRSLRSDQPHQIITTLDQAETLKRIDDYLTLLGYSPYSREPLIYERDGSFDLFLRCSPRGLKNQCHLTVSTDFNQDTLVTVTMLPQINPIMVYLVSKDWDFWSAEIEGLKAALVYGYVDTETSRMAAERAQWFSLGVQCALVFVLPALCCAAVGLLAWIGG